MNNSVTGAKFGAYTNIGRAKIDAWKSKDDANDCYWNLAKNQLGEGASNAEIYEVMNELVELNASKDEKTGEYNTIVYENQEVLLDLQSTINQSNKEIDEALGEYETIQSNFSSLTSKLQEANKVYLEALNSYNAAVKSADEESIKTVYSAYIQALDNLLSLKEEVENAQKDLDSSKENVEELKNALNELKEEYEQKESLNKELKSEFDKQIKDFEDKISAKQKEIETIKETAQKEIETAQKNQDAAVSSAMVNQDEEGNLTPKSQEELNNTVKTAQVENLKTQYSQVQKEQGFLGKAWNGLKNLFGTKYSSKNIEKTIEQVEKGEISADEAQKMIGEYQERQKSGVNTLTSIASGLAVVGCVALAPFSGGASLALGVALGAGTRVGLKTLDRASNDVKGDELNKKEMAKDAIVGGVEGLVTVATMGLGSAAVQTSKETGKVLVKETVKTGIKQGAKAGAIDGAATNAATYMADVAVGDKEFSGTELISTTTQGAAIGGTIGGVTGGVSSGVQARSASKALGDNIDDEAIAAIVKEEQRQAAEEMEETAIYSAQNTTKEAIEEAIADGRISNIDDALSMFSEKQLKEAGYYDVFAQNIDDSAADAIQKGTSEVVTDANNQAPAASKVDAPNADKAPSTDVTQEGTSKVATNTNNQTPTSSKVDTLNADKAPSTDAAKSEVTYFMDSKTGEVFKLKKGSNGFEQELIEPSSSEYQTAMKEIQGSNYQESASRIAASELSDSQRIAQIGKNSMLNAESKTPKKTMLQQYIEDRVKKGKPFDNSADAYIRDIADANEYCAIREAGAYARDYGTAAFVDNPKIVQQTINPVSLKPNGVGARQVAFVEAPNATGKLILNRERGWIYRASNTKAFSQEVVERFSANVKASKDMINALDGLVATGKYRNAAGELVEVKNISSFYYKTPEHVSKWNGRQDPLTFYFTEKVNNETKQAIAEITSKYARGGVNNADALYPWLSNVEVNPTNKMVDELAQKLKKYGLNSCAEKVNSWKTTGYYAHTSTGLYEAFSNIIKYIENSKNVAA